MSLNIGNYVHFADRLGDLTLDFYVLPENLDKAKQQFAQAKPMIEAFSKYFGEYPFKQDGYKLIQVPYSGMEHQSAVTYGNGFRERLSRARLDRRRREPEVRLHHHPRERPRMVRQRGLRGRRSDMWIHEGWTTYLECLYVEHMFGYDDALKYTNGYKPKVQNRAPIITQRGIHRSAAAGQYFKGALFLNTLRSVVNDDTQMVEAAARSVTRSSNIRNIMTEDIVRLLQHRARYGPDADLRSVSAPRGVTGAGACLQRCGTDLGVPVEGGGTRICDADSCRDARHVANDSPDNRLADHPAFVPKDTFEVATDLYYVHVIKQ